MCIVVVLKQEDKAHVESSSHGTHTVLEDPIITAQMCLITVADVAAPVLGFLLRH